jgi:hypothetical protein
MRRTLNGLDWQVAESTRPRRDEQKERAAR